MTLTERRVFFLEVMEHIAEAQTVTRNLICISRADAFTCSTDLLSAFRLFIGGVKQTVSRSNQMDFLGNFKNRTEIHPHSFPTLRPPA